MPVQPFQVARSVTVAPFECSAYGEEIEIETDFFAQIVIKIARFVIIAYSSQKNPFRVVGY
jgi:hypothetical protein